MLDFSVGEIRGSLSLDETLFMIRMVKLLPPSKINHLETESINLYGEDIPVYSVRTLFGLPYRSPRITDNLIITQIEEKKIALWVDSTYFFEEKDAPQKTEDTLPVTKFENYGLDLSENGVFIITDLELLIESRNNEPQTSISELFYRNMNGSLNLFKDASTEEDLLDPQRTRTILEERARELAHPRKEKDESIFIEVLKFQLAYKEYAIEMKYIREVIITREITPVPGTPDYIVGICAVRGEIISLIDLNNLLLIPKKGLTDLNQVIVISNGAITFGLLIDDIVGIENIQYETVLNKSSEPISTYHDYMLGTYERDVIVLDAGSLLSNPKMIIDESVP